MKYVDARKKLGIAIVDEWNYSRLEESEKS